MTPSPMLQDRDMLAVRATYSATLSACTPELRNLGAGLLDTLSDASWTLEWYLPRWLGEAFGLPRDQIQALVLANVYGLGYVRLQDDLTDEQMSQDSRRLTAALADILYRRAIEQYVLLFPDNSPFWRHLDAFMSEWRLATNANTLQPAIDFDRLASEDLIGFAGRGAPLKICGAAACLLGQGDNAIAPLSVALDHTLLAHVLLDHFDDWQDDLASGRFNLFVAYASPLAQTPDTCTENTGRVILELYGAGHGSGYFSLIRREMRVARKLVEVIPCPGLSAYLWSLEALAKNQAQDIAAQAKTRLQAAVAEALAPTPALSSPSA